MVDRDASKVRVVRLTRERRKSIIHAYFESLRQGVISLDDIAMNDTTVTAQVKFKNSNWSIGYMDEAIREWSSCCAEDLREVVGCNVFFDIRNGRIVVQV